MKKILSVFILFLSACSFIQTYDTEFKNPVFYQPLEPLSKIAGYTYLTPTSIDLREPNDKNKTYQKGKCQLIENTEGFIKLLCHINFIRDEKIIDNAIYSLKTTDNPIIKRSAEQDLIVYSGNYYENMYYTYTIKELFFDYCVKIEQNVYEIKGEHIRKVSTAYFCTPPLKN